MPIEELKRLIRSRSREQWVSHFSSYFGSVRTWLSNNGEISALFGLITGVIVVLFFKLVVFLAVVAGLVAYVVWILAEPGDGGSSDSGTD